MSQQQALQKAEEWGQEVVTLMQRPDRIEQFRRLLGSDDAVERFQTVALHAIVQDSKLRICEPLSIVEAVRESAVLGLEPTGILGEAWILPYGKLAQLRPGWQGYLKLVRNSGQVASIDCQVVYQKDFFEVEHGTNAHVTHKPYLPVERGDDRGDFVGAYAWAKLNNGELLVEWMPVADIEQVRKFSQAKSGPWFEFWGEMARKSVIRRFIKRLPKSPLLIRALELDIQGDKLDRGMSESPQALSPARQAAMAALEAHYPNAAENKPETTDSAVETEDSEEATSDSTEMSDDEIAKLVEP